MSSAAAAEPDLLLVNSSASDTGINAAPRAGPGPETWSREYCRERVRCWETFCVTLSFCCLGVVTGLSAWLTGADVRGSGARWQLRHRERLTDSGPEPRPRWLRLRHGVLNMSNITDMKQNDWQVITQPRWMTQTRNFDVYCKAAWRMIWRLRGYEVCQNYYPSFLSKVFLRAVPSLSLLQNASKKLKQNLVTSLTFDFNFIMFEQARHLYLTNYSSLLSFISSGFKVNVYIHIYNNFLIALNKIWWKYESFECVEG